MPDLETTIYQPYSSQGVNVVAIHPGESAGPLSDFIAQTGLTMPVVADQGTRWLFSYPTGVGFPYPRDVIIGKDGTVRDIRNSFNVTEVEALVQDLIAEPWP